MYLVFSNVIETNYGHLFVIHSLYMYKSLSDIRPTHNLVTCTTSFCFYWTLVLGDMLASRRAGHSLLWQMSLYIFDILFFFHLKFKCIIFMSSPLLLAVNPRSL